MFNVLGAAAAKAFGHFRRASHPHGVTVFLDESGTHDGSPRMLVGAVVVRDVFGFESSVRELHEAVIGGDQYWVLDPQKRSTFASRGFHHTEDSDSVRQALIDRLPALDFRAHVCFSSRLLDAPDDDVVLNMFYVLIRSLLQRYRGEPIRFVFEQSTGFNHLYARVLAEAVSSVSADAHSDSIPLDATAYIGVKPLAGLSVVDYVLALAEDRLKSIAAASGGKAKLDYRSARFTAIQAHVAHLVDFDRTIHRRGWTATLL